jgi:DNA-binding NtrC family response regulator
VSVDCGSLSLNEQLTALFGQKTQTLEESSTPNHKGIFLSADGGTVFLDHIDKLGRQAQLRLLRLIHRKTVLSNNDFRIVPADVRIICASGSDLAACVHSGEICEELYYVLASLVLEIPPLRNGPQQTRNLAEQMIKNYSKRYERYFALTTDAMNAIQRYPWYGNVMQLDSFCRKLVMTSKKRTLDKGMIETMLFKMYPVSIMKENASRLNYRQSEAAVILELLERHDGNRTAVANELQISTTTLWRKIKKYNIEAK